MKTWKKKIYIKLENRHLSRYYEEMFCILIIVYTMNVSKLIAYILISLAD